MDQSFKNCWEIKGCGREKGGSRVEELGECIASIEGLGHSCWAIAGTLCRGEVQGSVAQKEGNCMNCEVYLLYHRILGSQGELVSRLYPEEDNKLQEILQKRLAEL